MGVIKFLVTTFFVIVGFGVCIVAIAPKHHVADDAQPGGSALYKMAHSDATPDPAAPRAYVKESCASVAKRFDANTMTDLQRQSSWAQYENKWVKWSGTVGEVSDGIGGLSVQVKCRGSSIVSDIGVNFDDMWKQELVQLRPGQRISFEAQLTDYNSVLGLTGKQGALLTKGR